MQLGHCLQLEHNAYGQIEGPAAEEVKNFTEEIIGAAATDVGSNLHVSQIDIEQLVQNGVQATADGNTVSRSES